MAVRESKSIQAIIPLNVIAISGPAQSYSKVILLKIGRTVPLYNPVSELDLQTDDPHIPLQDSLVEKSAKQHPEHQSLSVFARHVFLICTTLQVSILPKGFHFWLFSPEDLAADCKSLSNNKKVRGLVHVEVS